MAPKNGKFEHFLSKPYIQKQIYHIKKWISWSAFCYNPLSEIGKKIGKMLKYTPHFQSAFGTAV